ncbi:MAG: division/cell wall cluster transcriptional repressor MraZ [Flavobacteriaceae bacterium]|nr:division/cell wall cluster transcriptional repressor MraZ [Flavobacteriaceae bacterium]MCY4268190.1 division/cell wall cluster transcriptional repressor MraZ [Flavobacteriaceae bacterium]MCY4300095.1 division/cell wall cluster transcriptional repressor MraZ [Flavobacteriaceae bacterium]
MSFLIGTYDCKVDAKGRLMLPVGLKKQLSHSLDHGFVLKRAVFGKGLELYPMQQWNIVSQKINQLNRFVSNNIEFIRGFNAGSRIVDIDTSGRLLIPKDLVIWAGISKEIVITASVNILEIWDKKTYEESLMPSEKLGELAQQVMGDQQMQNDLSGS